jgi:ring-1,2-phenylacetyl-CoA epoxidase subunit PaaE
VSTAVEQIRRIPDPGEPVPRVAWPTLALFIAGFGIYAVSCTLAVTGVWPWPISTLLNAIASFMLFTVSHEASHHSASSDDALNTWLGRFSTPMFAHHAGFGAWRFVHMQHHRFTNDDEGRDPDAYTNGGPGWLAPLRWLTIDLWYVVFYVPRLRSRARAEHVELAITLAVVVGGALTLILTGNLFWLLVLYLLPIRIAILALGWAFDYLPHHGLHDTPDENRFRATRNRVGAERVLSPLLLYQNYHRGHHLHPVIPFYRYVAVWRRGEDAYLANDPALSTVGGRPLTVDEYRRLRALADHH